MQKVQKGPRMTEVQLRLSDLLAAFDSADGEGHTAVDDITDGCAPRGRVIVSVLTFVRDWPPVRGLVDILKGLEGDMLSRDDFEGTPPLTLPRPYPYPNQPEP